MKTVLLFTFLIICKIGISQNEFSKGFQKGYKDGYCYDQFGCIPPIPPIPPIPLINESYNSYRDGYNRGFIKGLDDKKILNSDNYINKSNQENQDYIEKAKAKRLEEEKLFQEQNEKINRDRLEIYKQAIILDAERNKKIAEIAENNKNKIEVARNKLISKIYEVKEKCNYTIDKVNFAIKTYEEIKEIYSGYLNETNEIIWYYNTAYYCYENYHSCNKFSCIEYMVNTLKSTYDKEVNQWGKYYEKEDELNKNYPFEYFKNNYNVLNFNFGLSYNFDYITRTNFSISYERLLNRKISFNLEIGKLKSVYNYDVNDNKVVSNSIVLNPFFKIYHKSKKSFNNYSKKNRAPRDFYFGPSFLYNSGEALLKYDKCDFKYLDIGFITGFQGIINQHISIDFKFKYHPINILNTEKIYDKDDIYLYNKSKSLSPFLSIGMGYSF